jgi:hypothetical protein
MPFPSAREDVKISGQLPLIELIVPRILPTPQRNTDDPKNEEDHGEHPENMEGKARSSKDEDQQ